MKFHFFIALLLAPFLMHSQIQLERQVIASSSLNATGDIGLSSTSGQIEPATFFSPDLDLTQGFEQGELRMRSLEYEVIYPECDNGDPLLLIVELDSLCTGGEGDIELDGLPGNEVNEIESAGEYVLDIHCSSGSNFSIDVIIEPFTLPPCELEFYNTITPSNDLNYWVIENIDNSQFEDNKVQILNRWGAVVWEANGYNNGDIRWEGTDQDGDILPQGTYYYIVEVNGILFTGYIELIR